MKNGIYLAVIAFSIQAVRAQKYYLQCGNVFDPTSERWQKDKTIVVEGKRITEILNGFVDATGDDQNIDLKEAWVMPGFIDMHGQIGGVFQGAYPQYVFNLWLAHGITTVREPSGRGIDFSLDLKRKR